MLVGAFAFMLQLLVYVRGQYKTGALSRLLNSLTHSLLEILPKNAF